jgi:hypothetical protein
MNHGIVTIVFYDIRDACRAKYELTYDPLPCTSFDIEFVQEGDSTYVNAALLLRLSRPTHGGEPKIDLDEILRLLGTLRMVKTLHLGDRYWKYVEYYDCRDTEQALRGLTDITLQVSVFLTQMVDHKI